MDIMDIWERQPKETSTAYEAFCVYRDFGVSRTLDNVAKKLNKSATIMGRWSSQHNWVERATAYDDHIERLERQALEKARLKQREKRIKIAEAFQAQIVQAMAQFDLADIKFDNAVRAFHIVNAELRKDLGDDVDHKKIELSGDDDKPVVVKVVKGVSFDDL